MACAFVQALDPQFLVKIIFSSARFTVTLKFIMTFAYRWSSFLGLLAF